MLNVGEIVYLLDKKTQAVIPCMVVEKVNSVTLEGETTHHIISPPSGKKLRLENYKGPWFPTLDEARDFLIDTAKNLINATIEKAERVAVETFNLEPVGLEDHNVEENLGPTPLSSDAVSGSPEKVFVDLGDGQKVSVTLPDFGG